MPPAIIAVLNTHSDQKRRRDGDHRYVAVIHAAQALFDSDRTLCDAMAEAGAALVDPGERLLTHRNTGGLATADIGAALGVPYRLITDSMAASLMGAGQVAES